MILGRESLVNFYTTAGFNRAAQRRADSLWLKDMLNDPATRIHIVWRGRNLIDAQDLGSRMYLIRDHKRLIEEAEVVVLLGIEDGTAHVAIDLSSRSEESIAELGQPTDLRAIGALMSPREGGLAAFARGMAYWHGRHLFCGACGGPTRSEQAGHVRRCANPDCNVETFPRIDPAVIMRVTHGERILLGRQASWPPGMHSVLAGFVETGEALEDAVRRETFEEVGIRVEDVRYFGSQPWPFPSSLMVGFTAIAQDDALTIDRKEIDAACWRSRQELLACPENEDFRLPRRDSIARRLVEDWLSPE
jgi:NAD+ diphosphatase